MLNLKKMTLLAPLAIYFSWTNVMILLIMTEGIVEAHGM